MSMNTLRHCAPWALVAGDGIGIFDLEGVEVFIGAKSAQTCLIGYVRGIDLRIGHARLRKLLHALARERCAFVGQRLKEDAAVHLYIAVGQVEGDTGEAEAVFLLRAVHTADHRHIAVGYEIEALDFRGPGIVVFSHQQALASYQFLLAVEDARADAEVEAGGPAVGAGDYGGLPGPSER